MINLKDEKKTVSQVINSSYALGWNDCIDELQVKYNIITAPKSIKLSEIVSKLEKSLNNPKNKVNVYRENENEIVIKITYFARGTFVNEATIEMSNKIWDIDGLISARYKWLYTLWIAGTHIVDDLEGK